MQLVKTIIFNDEFQASSKAGYPLGTRLCDDWIGKGKAPQDFF
jgi:hypothetical protein